MIEALFEAREASRVLDDAHLSGAPIEGRVIQWDIDSAYEVQRLLVARRVDRGETPVGLKLGFTSRAKMRQMGVDDVIVGHLTDAMEVPDGGDLNLEGLIHPRVEPEVALRIGDDLDLDDPRCSVEAAIDAVAPAIEIIDSRYRDFLFSHGDVIADNTSGAAFVTGRWVSPRDLSNLAVRMTVGSTVAATGTTGAILGDPWRGLALLTSVARSQGFVLRRGDIILAGAATGAVPLVGGSVTTTIAGLGRVSFTATGTSMEEAS
ncbi:2-keto-4-pentenoate hydratase [Aeromicrobium sp. 9AM]|uniref:2-keto-4-pentenoate hydratase n=1 Tax=Aeromicrobium sp. 9AM TaxID=2653126 RepID=UPI0012F1A6A0|nr:fumarylacetoacetate hydrolase family protein [Aeromicrobium sp. 9AM]VXB07804.1 4-oxalocrotonate decarboxylase [Aeromicrobium sp. 9AM]